MVYDIDMLRSFYSNFPKRVDAARKHVGRPLTLGRENLICTFVQRIGHPSFPPW